MKRYNIILTCIIAILAINACSKDQMENYKTVNPGSTLTSPLNGEYWVRLDAATITNSDTTWSVDPYGLGYQKISIFNLASDKGDSIWIDDPNLWPFKSKVSCKPSQMTFNVTKSLDLYKGDSTTIENGKVILNGGITKTGNKVDSISMMAIWATDPANLYRISGVRRTGFQADDY